MEITRCIFPLVAPLFQSSWRLRLQNHVVFVSWVRRSDSAFIHARRDASPDESYTARLLTDVEDELLKKIAEEASEVIMACKDNDHDHIRYEAADLVYHLLVTLERYGVGIDDLAGELNARMK